MAWWVQREGDDSGVARWEVQGWERARAWCTGRAGGVSPPPFDTLNLSRGVGDAPAAVQENRRRALGAERAGTAVWARLVHGREIAWIGSGDAAPPADGLLTRDPAVTLAMTFADCVPVWLYAPDLPAVGLVHAGWRGTALGVVQAACAGLAAAGAAPERLYAAIGPAIGGCCYQVGEEVAERLRSLPDADGGIRSEGDGHYRVDLPWLNRAQLRAVGVPERHLASVALCTACHPGWFFSHRGGAGRTGRMGGFLCLTTP